MTSRQSARLRLAMVLTLLVVASGTALLGVSYALLRWNLTHDPAEIRDSIVSHLPPIGASEVVRTPLDSGLLVSFVDEAMSRLALQSGLALILLAASSLVTAWVLAGRILRPLARVTAEARQLGEGNLHRRINLHGPHDELRDLADTFDGMLNRLQAAFDSQRDFVERASHELRNPLAIIRAAVEVPAHDQDATLDDYRGACETARIAVSRGEELIDRLLALAGASSPLSLDRFDLVDVVEEGLSEVAREAAAKSVRVDLVLRPAEVIADRTLVIRMVVNLLQNAIRHNVESGWVHVETGVDPERVVFSVANGGAVIDPAIVAGFVDRFAQGPRRGGAGGYGLGLSIVEAVARAHGAGLTFQTPSTGGFVATARFLTPTASGRTT